MQAAIRRYQASPDVEYAETDFVMKPSQTTSANDPSYARMMRFSEDDSYMISSSSRVLVHALAYMGQTVIPSTIQKNTYFTAYGPLSGRHSGYKRVYFYRYYSGKWNYYTYVSAPNAASGSNTTYTSRHRLPYAGAWYVRAYHPGDAINAATWAPVKQSTVR